MSATRAKFKCISVEVFAEWKSVKLEPVTADTPENKTFFKYTPGGKVELNIVNKEVVFHPGREYYLDFTEAEPKA